MSDNIIEIRSVIQLKAVRFNWHMQVLEMKIFYNANNGP